MLYYYYYYYYYYHHLPFLYLSLFDRLSGLVIGVPGCKPRGSVFDSRPYQIFCITLGLELGPLSLLSINEEQLERKYSGSGLEN
jgi:hypothetical protein